MPVKLNLDDLHQRHRALTEPLAGAYREAAAVCMNRHHDSPAEMTVIDNGTRRSAELSWPVPDARMLAAWANEIDTTEFGAYGCVISAVELTRGLFAIRRAETGTGADYYVGRQGSGDDLEDCLRLEVSGLSSGPVGEVNRRLVEKVSQSLRGNSSLPALAGVVGFSAKMIMIQDV